MSRSPAAGVDTCAVCPRLCRGSCPVASGSGREAAVPAVIAGVLRDWRLGRADAALAQEAATLCTDCGGCQSHCELDRPLPDILRRTRAALLPAPAIEALWPIEGDGDLVAVDADERSFSVALARRLGRPVRRWPTGDRFGVAAVEHAEWLVQAEKLRAAAEGVSIVIADGGVARALGAAGVPFRWAHEVVSGLGDGLVRSCCMGAASQRCCGAAGPLAAYHPHDAARLARRWVEHQGHQVLDARCRGHLRASGFAARDAVDRLMENDA